MIRVSYKDLIKMDACSAGVKRFTKGRWFRTRVLNHKMGLWEICHKEKHNSEMDIWWLVSNIANRLAEKEMTYIVEQVRGTIKSLENISVEWTECDEKRFKAFNNNLKVIEEIGITLRSHRDVYGWQNDDYWRTLRKYRDHLRHMLDRILCGFWYADEPYNPMFDQIREKIYTLNLTIDWSRS